MSRRQPGGKAPPGSVYIKAGYSERGEAKRLGARWDKSAAGKAQARKFWPHDKRAAGCWFVPPGNDLTEFRQLWELSDSHDGYDDDDPYEDDDDGPMQWPDTSRYYAEAAMEMRHGLRVKQSHSLGAGTTLYISRGGVTDFTGDALVNAADEKCVYGKGVDGAVNMGNGKRAKNQPLIQERLALPVLRTQRGRWGEEEVRCETGDAKITTGGRLAVRNVIHAVAPNCASPTPLLLALALTSNPLHLQIALHPTSPEAASAGTVRSSRPTLRRWARPGTRACAAWRSRCSAAATSEAASRCPRCSRSASRPSPTAPVSTTLSNVHSALAFPR